MSASEVTTSAAPPLPAPRDKHLRRMADTIRALSMDAVEAANSGHPGMPMGMADIATVLWGQFLKFDPAAPSWPDRDRFILSNGHGSMLLYSLLHLTGYADMTMSEIKTFRKLGSRCAGHPERGHASGIEVTTGPLGQGIGNSVGMALAERLQATRYGKDLVDHYTYVFCGDGCLMEGISQEAISFAGNLKLGKLILFWDDNHISIDGPTDLARHEDELERFDASGWHTQRIDGHDTDAIADAIRKAQADDRPSMIACRTIIAFGAPTKANTAAAHGSALGKEEIAGTRERLGWTSPPFVVPADMVEAWHKIGQRSKAASAAWRERLAKSSKRAEFEAEQKGEIAKAARDALVALRQKFAADAPKTATRQASGSVLDALAPVLPPLIGGSADLTPSNNTKAKGQKVVNRDDFSGSYIHYGIREHGMAAAMNGMAAHGGIVPYGGTFLVFTDYCRPSIRLSALMKLRVIFVMTHDSIGLGEDGPTHQPVEHLAALRAIPHLQVFRPADALETAECWELALAHADRPSILALTRQPLAALRKDASENRSARGAYVLAEADGPRKVTLLATGSEVGIAMAAREQLAAKGAAAAVVSMPCWQLFEAQDEAYRRSVLGTAPRVGVEAAVEFGWNRYLGDRGKFIGMHDFGASAPIEALYPHFGITAEAVVEAALGLV
ncbi:MAG TPA: transketolase [Stellaceae bacterium]|jgi:transketolase|nr:transketolase [Stellaceae bacterium]